MLDDGAHQTREDSTVTAIHLDLLVRMLDALERRGLGGWLGGWLGCLFPHLGISGQGDGGRLVLLEVGLVNIPVLLAEDCIVSFAVDTLDHSR